MIGNPKLNHEEVELLYQHDFDIPRSSIEQILALSRNSLIEDLKEVLEEAIRNYEEYEKAFEENSREPIFLAPAHAIFLLGELGAIETLPTINKFFSQKEEIIDFWLGDLVTEELWQAFYKLAQADIVQLLPFLEEKVPHVFSKTPHQRAAFLYLGLNRKERQLVPIYQDTLRALVLQAKKTTAFTDENSNLTHAVFFALDYGLIGLIDEVEIAVKERLIEDYGPESWEIVQRELMENEPKDKIQNIFDHYNSIKEWYNFEEQITDWKFLENNIHNSREFDYKPKEKIIDPRLLPKRVDNGSGPYKKTSPDVGRNEPCPCGSGKKYKKCCLKK